MIPNTIDINAPPSHVRGVVSEPPFVHLARLLTPFHLIHIISDTHRATASQLCRLSDVAHRFHHLYRFDEPKHEVGKDTTYCQGSGIVGQEKGRCGERRCHPRCYGRCELQRCRSRSSTPPLPPLSSIINDPSFKNAGTHLYPWTGTPLCHLFRGIHTFRFSCTTRTPGGTTFV